MTGLFDRIDIWREQSVAAAANPEVGMGFHEMYSTWVFVVAVTDDEVQVVGGYGHPSWFPECGTAKTLPRAEFADFVRYEYLADVRYSVEGWGERAEGLTKDALEQRIRETGSRRPS